LGFVWFELGVSLMYFYVLWCSPREMNKGEEVGWYADGDNMVRNEYNPSIAYAFGECREFISTCPLDADLYCS
jgi:hypothetical protein